MDIPNENAAVADDTLGPLNKVIPKVIDGEKNPATYSRWVTKGIAGLDGKRIRLQVWYAGREPRTTITAVRSFISAVTEARLARMARTQQRADDVTDSELEAAGLALHGGRNRQTTRPPQSLKGCDGFSGANEVTANPKTPGDSNCGSRPQTTEHPEQREIEYRTCHRRFRSAQTDHQG